MFGINEGWRLDQFIAKKNFLTLAELNKTEKEDLSNNVKKITLSFQLEPSKSNIKSYKDELREYPLINFFTIEVAQGANTKRIAKLVMSAIPYPCVIVFRHEDDMQIAVAHQRINQNDSDKNVLDEIITTELQPYKEMFFDIEAMNLSNFYTLYSDIVDFISIHNAKQSGAVKDETPIDGEKARLLLANKQQIELQISSLRARLKKETQFNRKMEINVEIKSLEKRLEG